MKGTIGGDMEQEQPNIFRCTTCGAAYKVVRIEAPAAHDKEVVCLSCGAPLSAREGRFALKYFLVGDRRARA
jgi:predicted RNA-binding Zn-ribbon protein involved in translation (DUF1610 family)